MGLRNRWEVTVESLSFKDICELQSVRQRDIWTYSEFEDLLALMIGKPICGVARATTAFGGMSEESQIFVANLKQSQLDLVPIFGVAHRSSHATNPVWSPDGQHLAFIWIVPDKNPDHTPKAYVGVWSFTTKTAHQIVRIPFNNNNYYSNAFAWTEHKKLLITHLLSENAPPLVANPYSEQAHLWRVARNSSGVTSSVLDSEVTYRETGSETGNCALGLFDFESHAEKKWSIPCDSADTFFMSPAGNSYITVLDQEVREGCSVAASEILYWKIDNSKASETQKTSLAPWRIELQNIIWHPRKQAILTLLFHTKKQYACLANIDLADGTITLFEDFLFENNLLHVPESRPIFENGDVLFFASPLDKIGLSQRAEWYSLCNETSSLQCASRTLDIVPKTLFACGEGVYLSVVDGVLIRYLMTSHGLRASTVFIDKKQHAETCKIVWPKVRANEIAAAPVTQTNNHLIVIQCATTDEIWHLVTKDGREFSSVELKKNDEIKSETVSAKLNGLSVLRTDATGNHIGVIVGKKWQPIAHLNSHIAQVGHAKTVFFDAAKDGQEPLPCELLRAHNHHKGILPATIVLIYPQSQYFAHNRIHPHNSPFPPSLNPHLFAAHGYNVLHAALPIKPKLSAFSQISHFVDLAIESAVERGLIEDKNLFAIGHSWGGNATAGLLTQSDRFNGAIAMAGAYNPIGWHGRLDPRTELNISPDTQTDSAYFARNTVLASADPWEDIQPYLESSPFLLADQINTPLMLVHGSLDFVPISQAEQLFSALSKLGRQVRFIRYQGEGHVICASENVADLWENMLQFLDQFKD